MYSLEQYLTPTDIIDSDSETVINYMKSVIGIDNIPYREKAVRLYLRVRDGIRYNPYLPFYKPEHYRASNVIKSGEGFCITKASLLCALTRAAGIPSRVGFATVKNHLSTKQLIDYLGTDVIVYHGYTEMWLDEKWVKATPAFNAELCALHKVPPLEFDGINDSIFHAYNSENAKYMEYISYHGEYSDVPVKQILKAWEEAYGEERVAAWIDRIENKDKHGGMDFMKEDII